jgi:hypothetical protein
MKGPPISEFVSFLAWCGSQFEASCDDILDDVSTACDGAKMPRSES